LSNDVQRSLASSLTISATIRSSASVSTDMEVASNESTGCGPGVTPAAIRWASPGAPGSISGEAPDRLHSAEPPQLQHYSLVDPFTLDRMARVSWRAVPCRVTWSNCGKAPAQQEPELSHHILAQCVMQSSCASKRRCCAQWLPASTY
jgi:hypothetical protein